MKHVITTMIGTVKLLEISQKCQSFSHFHYQSVFTAEEKVFSCRLLLCHRHGSSEKDYYLSIELKMIAVYAETTKHHMDMIFSRNRLS